MTKMQCFTLIGVYSKEVSREQTCMFVLFFFSLFVYLFVDLFLNNRFLCKNNLETIPDDTFVHFNKLAKW